jgi:arylsulfatase A-like enzyme
MATLALAVAMARLTTATPPPQLLSARASAKDVRWTHCALGEGRPTRPASGCVPASRIVMAGSAPATDTRIDIPIPTGPFPGEHGWLRTLAYLFEPERVPKAFREGIANPAVTNQLSSSATPRFLEQSFRAVTGFATCPQPRVSWSTVPPTTLALNVPMPSPTAQIVYFVWAWPGARHEHRVVLDPFSPIAGETLALAYGVHERGWEPESPAVLFEVHVATADEPERVVWTRRIEPAGRDGERGWLEQEVDLGPFVGKSIQVTLVAEVVGAPEATSFPVWAQPIRVAPATDTARPNVLLVSLDTVRADHAVGSPRAPQTFPALDRLAGRGAYFSAAFSTFSSTMGSHMSMLTSLWPCAHHVLAPVDVNAGGGLTAQATTVAELLGRAGYATAAFTEDGMIDGPTGFNRGFDVYHDRNGADVRPLGVFGEGIDAAAGWIEHHAAHRFFLFLHTYQPHHPWKVPRHLAPGNVPPSDPGIDVPAYDAGLRYTDDLLAGFLGQLARRGILDDTLVIVTSDHGEAFGEHDAVGHGTSVYNEQVHVPLVLAHPRLASGGRRIDLVVSGIDIAPTIADAAGTVAPPTWQGRSLLRVLAGDTTGVPAVAEQLLGQRVTMLRTETHAFVLTDDRIQVFDPRVDPSQTHDLSAADPVTAAEGRARVQAVRTECERVRETLGPRGASVPIDPERRRALEALGYAQ